MPREATSSIRYLSLRASLATRRECWAERIFSRSAVTCVTNFSNSRSRLWISSFSSSLLRDISFALSTSHCVLALSSALVAIKNQCKQRNSQFSRQIYLFLKKSFVRTWHKFELSSEFIVLWFKSPCFFLSSISGVHVKGNKIYSSSPSVFQLTIPLHQFLIGSRHLSEFTISCFNCLRQTQLTLSQSFARSTNNLVEIRKEWTFSSSTLDTLREIEKVGVLSHLSLW